MFSNLIGFTDVSSCCYMKNQRSLDSYNQNNRGVSEVDKKSDRSSWVIGGTTVIGVGVGLMFLQTSALLFVASILIGIGAGLVIASFVSRN